MKPNLTKIIVMVCSVLATQAFSWTSADSTALAKGVTLQPARPELCGNAAEQTTTLPTNALKVEINSAWNAVIITVDKSKTDQYAVSAANNPLWNAVSAAQWFGYPTSNGLAVTSNIRNLFIPLQASNADQLIRFLMQARSTETYIDISYYNSYYLQYRGYRIKSISLRAQ